MSQYRITKVEWKEPGNVPYVNIGVKLRPSSECPSDLVECPVVLKHFQFEDDGSPRNNEVKTIKIVNGMPMTVTEVSQSFERVTHTYTYKRDFRGDADHIRFDRVPECVADGLIKNFSHLLDIRKGATDKASYHRADPCVAISQPAETTDNRISLAVAKVRVRSLGKDGRLTEMEHSNSGHVSASSASERADARLPMR